MRQLTNKELDILFDLWYGRFDYNEETANIYNQLRNEGLTSNEVLNKLFKKGEKKMDEIKMMYVENENFKGYVPVIWDETLGWVYVELDYYELQSPEQMN